MHAPRAGQRRWRARGRTVGFLRGKCAAFGAFERTLGRRRYAAEVVVAFSAMAAGGAGGEEAVGGDKPDGEGYPERDGESAGEGRVGPAAVRRGPARGPGPLAAARAPRNTTGHWDGGWVAWGGGHREDPPRVDERALVQSEHVAAGVDGERPEEAEEVAQQRGRTQRDAGPGQGVPNFGAGEHGLSLPPGGARSAQRDACPHSGPVIA